jgi:hypothetical protein
MNVKTGSVLAVGLFGLVAFLHLVRMLSGTEITVGGIVVPLWASLPGVIVPGYIAWLLWSESKLQRRNK